MSWLPSNLPAYGSPLHDAAAMAAAVLLTLMHVFTTLPLVLATVSGNFTIPVFQRANAQCWQQSTIVSLTTSGVNSVFVYSFLHEQLQVLDQVLQSQSPISRGRYIQAIAPLEPHRGICAASMNWSMQLGLSLAAAL